MPSKTSANPGAICKTKRGNQHSKRLDPAYWEAKLRRMDLSMTRGDKIGELNHIIYGQDIKVLDFFASELDVELVPFDGGEIGTDEE